MAKGKSKAPLVAALVVLFAAQFALQAGFLGPFWRKHYMPKTSAGGGLLVQNLGVDQVLLQLFGFREFLAGILWVRADGFFDQGNYDAILPIIRLVTILDPKQIDVFSTGMWHIAYNFTDEQNRSDRRYIPAALALGQEGASQNPNTYELFFETGWIWYHKIDDNYEKAVKWFEEANKREDMIPARRNLLAASYQRDGDPRKALDTYYDLFDQASQRWKGQGDWSDSTNRDTIENNIDTTLVRMSQRGWFAKEDGRPNKGYDNSPPFDVGFSAKLSVIEPRVIKAEGTWNVLPVGTRIRIVLRDANFPNAIPAGMVWDYAKDVVLDPPKDQTFMQDQLFVRNRRFNRTIDMSKDPTMYPFTSDRYIVEFYYNPRSAAPHMQDKFSWDGSGFTDKNFLNTEVREGQRVLFAQLELTRDQIMRRGDWRDRVPVVKTKNYVEVPSVGGSDVIQLDIPSLRSGAGAGGPAPAPISRE